MNFYIGLIITMHIWFDLTYNQWLFFFSNTEATSVVRIVVNTYICLIIYSEYTSLSLSIWVMVIVTIPFIYYQWRWQNGKRGFSTSFTIATLKFFSCCFLFIQREHACRQRCILLSTMAVSTHIYIYMR